MSSLRPDLSSYSRISYARELLGRPDAAKQAMTLALDAAGGQPEPTAWVETQLGKLAWSHGRIGEAESHYRAALVDLSRLRLRARAARAGPRRRRAATAPRSRSRDARPTCFRFRRPSRRSATCTRAHGRRRAAQRQYALVDVIGGCSSRTACAPTSRLHSSTSTTASGLGARLRPRGRRDARARASTGTTSWRWALERNGRCAEALPYSRRALRLGTHDALKYFHRGMIERCLGHESRPWFVEACG